MDNTIIKYAIKGAALDLRKARKSGDEDSIKKSREYLIKLRSLDKVESIERLALNRKLRMDD